MARKILDILKDGTNYLSSSGVEDPRMEADLLLAFVLGISRDKLYLEREQEVFLKAQKEFARLLRLRAARKPLAYILKTREFMGLDFYVDERVLIPRPETELLVEKMLEMEKLREKLQDYQARILDLCTGSGAIAVSAAFYCPSARVVATDISPEALEVARYNAEKNKVNVEFRLGDLLEPVKGEKFDWILTNPPYVSWDEYRKCSPEVREEPSLALLGGKDGLDFYRRLAGEARDYLNSGGRLLMEIGCTQGEQVCSLFQAKGFRTTVFPDLAGLDRIVLAEPE